MEREAILVDLDDTVIRTGEMYELHIRQFCDYMEGHGIDPKLARSTYEEIDLANLRSGVYSLKDRFPISMGDAFERLCGPSAEGRRQAEEVGWSLYMRPARIMPHAHETLTLLSRTHDLYIYTAGDEQIQQRRVNQASLRPLVRGVVVTPKKNVDALLRTLDQLGLDPDRTWMLGNSKKSDILPAVTVGLRSIWIDSYSWAGDAAEVTPLYTITDLAEVPAIVNGLVPRLAADPQRTPAI